MLLRSPAICGTKQKLHQDADNQNCNWHAYYEEQCVVKLYAQILNQENKNLKCPISVGLLAFDAGGRNLSSLI